MTIGFTYILNENESSHLGNGPFVVLKTLSEVTFEIKLLSMPEFKSAHPDVQLGCANVTKSFINQKCHKISIHELVKSWLFPNHVLFSF